MRRSSLLFGALLLVGAALPLAGASAQDSAETDKRIQRLEEQIVDLNAQLGTVSTMSQGGSGAGGGPQTGPSGFGGGGGGGDLSEIEGQVRTLSSQMGEILRRLDQIERRAGSLAPGRGQGGRQGAADPDPDEVDTEQGTGFSVGGDTAARPRTGSNSSSNPARNSGSSSSSNTDSGAGGFGTTIEPGGSSGSSGNRSSGGANLSGYSEGSNAEPSASGGSASSGSAPVRTAARSSPQAQALYDRAYNALVQRNYRAASDGFEEFVQSNSTDPLAGSAYFWLGEAAFTSGEYRKAADSFLKSSTNYPQNEKAAESLLKLGISLKRLGENQAACSSFAELARRFPSATPVLQRAEREKSRAQC